MKPSFGKIINLEIETKKLSSEKLVNFLRNEKCYKKNEKIDKENRRISVEVKRVFMSCQIILLVLDIRNPLGTWPSFLHHRFKNRSQKIILVLNKCDLVPFWVLERWLKLLSKNFLVFGFFCKKKNENGKKKILCILRQLKKKFYCEREKIFIGVVGYPNVGKSSFINTVIGKQCLNVSPIPGQTKIWQFVKLSKEIFLIDSPGIVLGENFSKDLNILKGTTRIDKITEYNPEILGTLKKLVGRVRSKNWKSITSSKKISEKSLNDNFPLIGGGQKNTHLPTNIIIKDFISGLLPWFSPIPFIKSAENKKYMNINWIFFNPYTRPF